MIDYKHSVFYQIWPRSFKDSNNDGIGDIQGIIQKLDYLQGLGIDAIWLSPVYQSPNDDYGYDISDYYSINPEFGTMDDLDQLISECNKRNIYLVMDLVANHTSTKHHWFREALNNPQSKYRDFYFFKQGRDGNPPNNWISFFGDSAWTKVDNSDTYFLATFADTQADLNWANPEVRKEIYKIMKYYLDKGVAGFRMDVINTIDKIPGLPDKDPELEGLQFPNEFIIDRPLVDKYLKEMNQEVLTPYDVLGLGECVLTTPEAAIRYTNPAHHELNMTFHFDIAQLGYGELGKYDCRKLYRYTNSELKAITRKWQKAQIEDGAYIGNYLSNHDHKRHLDRFGSGGKYREVSAKALALYNFGLYGSPFIYQGEEIGMTNPHLSKKDWKDYECIHSCETMQKMLGIPPLIAEAISNKQTRDNARTPVQWSNKKYAGFSTHKPWIKLNPRYRQINVEASLEDDNSIYYFYKELIRLRHENEVLCTGSFEEIDPDHKNVIAWFRKNDEDTILIIVNLSSTNQTIKIPHCFGAVSRLHNYDPRFLRPTMKLRPYEALLFIKEQ